MKYVNELQTLDADQLATATGGDFAHIYRKTLQRDFHDWRMRTGAAFTSLATRDVKGTVKNVIAADLNYAKTAQDALFPVSAFTSAKP